MIREWLKEKSVTVKQFWIFMTHRLRFSGRLIEASHWSCCKKWLLFHARSPKVNNPVLSHIDKFFWKIREYYLVYSKGLEYQRISMLAVAHLKYVIKSLFAWFENNYDQLKAVIPLISFNCCHQLTRISEVCWCNWQKLTS